jgi:hypothetical protein
MYDTKSVAFTCYFEILNNRGRRFSPRQATKNSAVFYNPRFDKTPEAGAKVERQWQRFFSLAGF